MRNGSVSAICIEKIIRPEQIWGFDIDLQAVNIAKVNLILEFPSHDFHPNIYHKNALLDVSTEDLFSEIEIPSFDSIITNPPWGVHFTKTETELLKQKYPEVKSNEAFSYFINQSHKLLKNNGKLSFVLPEAILNIKTHNDIRHLMLTETQIKKIAHLDRVFKNVFTPVIRIDFVKAKPSNNHNFVSQSKAGSFKVKQDEYLKNKDYILNVFSDERDTSLFKKMYDRKHVTLQGNAEWALGVVTGNNKKHLHTKQSDGFEPILTGKDIKRYTTRDASNYIDFQPENFQQVAPTDKYRAKEKLLYKFISKQLVFAYDDKQTLTLNSANLLIPNLDYSSKTILALFNSTPYQFLYQKKFGAIKALRKDIEQLPLPEIADSQHRAISKMVDELLDKSLAFERRKQKHEELDDYIMDLFDFSDTEKRHLINEVKNSEKLLEIN